MSRLLAVIIFAASLGCGASPCARVCQKLDSCGALALADGGTDGAEPACEQDCANPPSGHTCTNENSIAGCIEQASCEELTSESSRLQCPSCQ
jgi:hypothetical protein